MTDRSAPRRASIAATLVGSLAIVFGCGVASAQTTKPAPAAPPAAPLTILPPPKQLTDPKAQPSATKKVDKPAVKPDREATIARVNTYLNGIVSLTGDFQQISPDGRRLQGKLYLLKPGRIRFEYDAPATLEVVADGKSVAVRDRRLNTQDLYNIGQTPLKFLVREQVDITKETSVVDVQGNGETVTVTLEDKATLTGTSRIKLSFEAESFVLKEWIVRDPQGSETQVRLANLDATKKPNAKLFTINYERMVEDKR